MGVLSEKGGVSKGIEKGRCNTSLHANEQGSREWISCTQTQKEGGAKPSNMDK